MVGRTAIGGSATLAPRSTGVGPGRGVLAVVVVTLALTPLVNPKGPGNTALVDVLMGLSTFSVFAWALRNREAVRLPYIVPMTGLMLTGLASALVSVAPANGVLAIVQEIFLILWCGALVTLCRTRVGLRLVLRTWALTATAWAALLVLAVAGNVSFLLGTTNGGGARVRLFFDHPNMAGNYFMIAFFVVVAAGYPRRLWLRSGACGLLLLAVLLTGSNAALLSLVAGVMATLFLHVRARSGLIKATAVVTIVVGALGVGWFTIGAPVLAAAQQSDNSLLRYSVGRADRSAEGRVDLFQSQLDLYEKGDLLGIGPATTFQTLDAEGATLVKEAHSDYLGTLVERGPLGLLFVLGLFGTVVARLIGPTSRPLSARLHAVVPVPAALAGACVAFAATAVTHEVLHYRWLWTLLAVVAALHLLERAYPADRHRSGTAAWTGHDARPPTTGVVRASGG
jgi:O-antigen ligase